MIERAKTSARAALGVACAGLLLAGCAASNAGGDPGAMAMPAGQSCQSVRAELNRLDSKGTQSKVEAASRGQRLAPAAQADVDRYNQLLNLYLGARCHA